MAKVQKFLVPEPLKGSKVVFSGNSVTSSWLNYPSTVGPDGQTLEIDSYLCSSNRKPPANHQKVPTPGAVGCICRFVQMLEEGPEIGRLADGWGFSPLHGLARIVEKLSPAAIPISTGGTTVPRSHNIILYDPI